MALAFGPRRAVYIDLLGDKARAAEPLAPDDLRHFEKLDHIYRSLCGVLFNYVPKSGHPGGSISSGRMVSGLLFHTLDCDLKAPARSDADLLSYAAGHKALGLYAFWALRNEIAKLGAPELLPESLKDQLRIEDLLGFRRNPCTDTPLFQSFNSKALDGHPTPTVPHVRLSTGASGVGGPSSLGLALAARDYFGKNAPRVHIIEGEGGLTPGRSAEGLAAAATCRLDNVVYHLDWNQASIDSDQVCRDGDTPGDYVQWDPRELFYLNDWNVIYCDGLDFQQVMAAQREAAALHNGQPTAIVYRTVKGWQYGIEGKKSHGGGHGLCSKEYFATLTPLLGDRTDNIPNCFDCDNRCDVADGRRVREECYWAALTQIREFLAEDTALVSHMADRLRASRKRLDARGLKPRAGAPEIEPLINFATESSEEVPEELQLAAGTKTTLRGALGNCLNYYSKLGNGSLLVSAADLFGSTSANKIDGGKAGGFFDAQDNPEARLISIGGICEDGISAMMSGVSAFGHHMGVASSYGAFIAPLSHIASRLHAIGNQARNEQCGGPKYPLIIICAHAGMKTGEDGPTHADPQALQLFDENFPKGMSITLTPFDPAEIWHLVSAAFARRPALVVPFVTRPNETVPDRKALGLAPASDARQGLYCLRKAQGKGDGTLVIQGSGVALAFIEETLPLLNKDGIDLNVYYVSSAELFDLLPKEEQAAIFPAERAAEAMGMTGFTLPTLYRFIRTEKGRELSLFPHREGHFLGSGQADQVIKEAGLDGPGQYRGIRRYLEQRSSF